MSQRTFVFPGNPRVYSSTLIPSEVSSLTCSKREAFISSLWENDLSLSRATLSKTDIQSQELYKFLTCSKPLHVGSKHNPTGECQHQGKEMGVLGTEAQGSDSANVWFFREERQIFMFPKSHAFPFIKFLPEVTTLRGLLAKILGLSVEKKERCTWKTQNYR